MRKIIKKETGNLKSDGTPELRLAFCPTGPGGGKDPSCGKDHAKAADLHDEAAKAHRMAVDGTPSGSRAANSLSSKALKASIKASGNSKDIPDIARQAALNGNQAAYARQRGMQARGPQAAQSAAKSANEGHKRAAEFHEHAASRHRNAAPKEDKRQGPRAHHYDPG
jgi:hypothetical protein